MIPPGKDSSPQKNSALAVQNCPELSTDDRLAILDAFTQLALRGLSIVIAFEESPHMSRSRYYELRNLHPDEIAALEEEGRQRAIELREEKREAFTAQREDAGIDVAVTAAAGLQLAIPHLVRIARGEHIETTDARGRKKILFSYPRDVAQAAALLHQLSKEGVWRDDEPMPVLQQNKGRETLPAFVGLDWTKAAVELDDGTVITASRPEIIEGEAEEV